ncbi:hypothetical protein PPTG_03392 [Phytophthora nicotianae INRA-310]|uniref:Uncharacterized protein n=1 Tax=Phytophthora nicotianae (strain INRA-310) TaxID=761204 RepID=W2R6P6_PHYN3|nr:hypothetical protein PPTG_03392 [Phytophthora nicotianae INRA-310]ETN20369.1 hypothetical protein PPTG_03392 [Phytophthora nicotianae INRA-310]
MQRETLSDASGYDRPAPQWSRLLHVVMVALKESGWDVGRKARANDADATSPPNFRGSTAHEKQVFIEKYEAYCRQLSALETAFFRPFRIPVGRCEEDERRRLIAMFDSCKPLDEIAEAYWTNYFWEGQIAGELDFDKVKTIMSSKLSIDTRLANADSHVSKLAHEMYQALDKETMEWMVQKKPKKLFSSKNRRN